MTHMGPVGDRSGYQVVNQQIGLTNYCVLAEALRLAQAYGVDARKIPEGRSRPGMPALISWLSPFPADDRRGFRAAGLRPSGAEGS